MKKKIAALIGVGTFLILVSQVAWADVQAAEASSGIIGSWVSILPPLVAIAIALAFRQVLFALFLGIWMGAYLIGDLTFTGIFDSFFEALSGYIVPGVSDPDRMSIVVFSILIGGMVGIITDNGGTRGVITAITRFVRTKVQGMVVTSLMGFIVFFDDYANTMVVGNTMRPLTDKLRISRAKLAYLVDATAAPVATVALVSTWIGAMVGFIATAQAEMPDFNEAAYSVFINSLPYNFYAFFTILFVILIAYSGRDFGTMLKARITLYKAKHDSKLDKYNLYKDKIEEDEEKKSESHWANAALPILTLVFGTIIGLFVTGEGDNIQGIIETANSYDALLWGSLASVVVAVAMTLGQKLLDVEKTLEGMMNGMHVMFDGVLILVLAWALSDVTVALGTADYLVSVFGETLNPYWMPAIVLVLSALTAFATGSSWGTMGILMPLVVPLGWEIGNATGIPAEMTLEVIYASVSAVLAGSVWGDHCSPISDTTILSSIATQCDHVEHVNTQLPYALIVGGISILAMISALVLNVSVWIIYPAGVALIIAIIYKFGKIPDPEEYTPEGKEAAITSLD
ncbi:MAG: Na+/H+ antiporter NhaC family protein [Gracilimonas sp.]|uniref:Na+/H+ antiporter NhaC family protein n=1 Tax=Gracilimonas sp. TaxID=1974203 RepID=UPI00199D6D83|nr:Na+/H+ antiporter NhaC family protein [Gracilimonas sp.]MBD3617765.1 Na+/H+ antiporter NhaC family protein [Gracilimonas sp.]